MSECHSICERGAAADNRASRFDIRTVIEQSIEHRNIVTAGGPMKRCLAVAATNHWSIHIGTGVN